MTNHFVVQELSSIKNVLKDILHELKRANDTAEKIEKAKKQDELDRLEIRSITGSYL